MTASRTEVDAAVYTRLDVDIASEGDLLSAWVYRPNAKQGQGNGLLPIIVMAPGMGSIKDLRLDAFGDAFARAGYASVIFDYRCNGKSTGLPRNLIDADWQYEDWLAAVAFARQLEFADPDRLTVMGCSFAGGNAIKLAAEHPDLVHSVIAACPFTDGVASAFSSVSFYQLMVLSFWGLADVLFGTKTRPITVDLLGQPGSVSLLNTNGILTEIARVIPSTVFAGLIRDSFTVPARLAFKLPFLKPGKYFSKIQAPILVTIATEDVITPPVATMKHARAAEKLEVKVYECRHFGIYVGEVFDQVASDCVDFLNRHG